MSISVTGDMEGGYRMGFQKGGFVVMHGNFVAAARHDQKPTLLVFSRMGHIFMTGPNTGPQNDMSDRAEVIRLPKGSLAIPWKGRANIEYWPGGYRPSTPSLLREAMNRLVPLQASKPASFLVLEHHPLNTDGSKRIRVLQVWRDGELVADHTTDPSSET